MGHDHIGKGTLSYGDVGEGMEAGAGKLALSFWVAIMMLQARLMHLYRRKSWISNLYYLYRAVFLGDEGRMGLLVE